MRKAVTLMTAAVALMSASAASAETSRNWAGWVDVLHRGYALQGVRAFFQVPVVNAAKTTNGSGGNRASFWVGLGGHEKHDPLIQAGVAESANKNGTPESRAWWEVEPSPGGLRFPGTYEQDFPNKPGRCGHVHPGDHMEVDIGANVVGGKTHGYMDLLDQSCSYTTWHKDFALPGHVSSESAEVIAERPTCRHVCNLTAFSPVTFQGELFMTGPGVPANGRVPMDVNLGYSLRKLTLVDPHGKALTKTKNAPGSPHTVEVLWRRGE